MQYSCTHTIFAQFKWHSKIEDDNKSIPPLRWLAVHKNGTHFDGGAFACVCVIKKTMECVQNFQFYVRWAREKN